MDNKDFWRVYHEHLEMVAGLAGKGCLLRCRTLGYHIIIECFC